MHRDSNQSGPVECFGLCFESEDARRTLFIEKLREKLKDPQFRQIQGFPIGSDEDILRLSDPPYYTACPNPFVADFVRQYGGPYDPNERYDRRPMAVDVSEGKTDPIYTAHAYHTKVPPKAIMRAILHYTDPGDVVMDGFAGSGMTGVAAQLCGVPDPQFKKQVEDEAIAGGNAAPIWGARRAIIADLAPVASFMAANYNTPLDVVAFHNEARKLLDDLKTEIGWMYETLHIDGRSKGFINYTVWSEVFACPDCAKEVVFLKEALDRASGEVREAFPCPHCRVSLSKAQMQRIKEVVYDVTLEQTIDIPKRLPVLINYSVAGHSFEKEPDATDYEVLRRVAALAPPADFRADRMMHVPDGVDRWGDKWRAGTASFSHVHHLFLPRARHALACLWRKTCSLNQSRIRNSLMFFSEQAIWGMSVLARYVPTHYSQVNQYLTGVYYVPSQHAECTPWYILEGKLRRLCDTFTRLRFHTNDCIIATSSASESGLPSDSVDYIFTDPPFGDNLAYAELNFLIEAFHRVFTNSAPEAIISPTQHKGLLEYQDLMRACFSEYSRVLKPGRWITVVFHNSKNSIWNAIQESLQEAGLVVADVRVLDKQQSAFNQVVAAGSVKRDLVISAYKPNGGLEGRFQLERGTEEGLWDFVRTHLRQLPLCANRDGSVEVIAERQAFLLFDRMVAFHVQRGVTVPLSAGEFYAGLARRFVGRDGGYFLSDQVDEYDRKRMKAGDVKQLEIFVRNESSAIQWLRQQLAGKPQTFQELFPRFIKEIAGWQKHERPLELKELLEENFLHYDGTGEVPSQIHSYLSTNFHDLRKLCKDSPVLRQKGKDRYYVPDPNKEIDVQKSREKALLREFDEYREGKQKKLKVFRVEAVRAGFRRGWQQNDYATILSVAEKIPEDVLQEDPMLLMWYTSSLTRAGRQS